MSTPRLALLALVVAGWSASASAAAAQTARERYEAGQSSEAGARQLIERVPSPAPATARTAAMTASRRAIARYEGLVRRFPTSGYADNALFQAAELSRTLYERFERADDRTAALKYYAWLAREYPASSLARQARTATRTLTAVATAPATPSKAVPAPVPDSRPALATSATRPTPPPPPVPAAASAAEPVPSSSRSAAAGALTPAAAKPATLTRIERVVLGGLSRVMLHVDGDVSFASDVISGPPRAYVDLQGATPAAALVDAHLRFDDGAVRRVRVGRQSGATRVVFELDGSPRVSVFTLANPFRVVIDADSTAAGLMAEGAIETAPPPPPAPVPAATPSLAIAPPPSVVPAIAAAAATADAAPTAGPAPAPPFEGTLKVEPLTIDPGTPLPEPEPAMPGPPAANGDGSFSLARQLGLGVSRIVIDAGHGGHDPGTLLSGSNEAAIVLDVALRLEKLLKKEPGLDVVLTRRTNTFVPLEERTAIANREGADLFLSIHANASRNASARGIETYYLSFASNPEAEAVAARENATSARDMHNLPGIVRAIALNTKLDESRDLATLVQESMASKLPRPAGEPRNRGVKKAPFVVLIGAGMPSILTEIGFLTNKTEAALLKTPAYRQKVAEALQASVMSYRRALKRQSAVAAR